MKVVTVIGARPQFVKAAVVSRAIKSFNNEKGQDIVREIIVHTGQHYDKNMSEVFFQEMQIPAPQYHLGIGGSSHGKMTGRMIEKIEEVLIQEKPDAMLVYGDTNSTLAGALAAAKLHVPIAHVEAGLRSFNMNMPEEVNRILTDRISRWLFCPTLQAIRNLEQEGINFWRNTSKNELPIIENVGDVMYDAALYYIRSAKCSDRVKTLINKYQDGFYLATVHRAENSDNQEKIRGIFRALNTIASDIPVIILLHPRTNKRMNEFGIIPDNLITIEPVGHFDMLHLLSHSHAVFTDSGGVQKEAYFFSKPCVTLREETEWVELVDHGFNILAGTDYDAIIESERGLHNMKLDFSTRLYGSGNAADLIVSRMFA